MTDDTGTTREWPHAWTWPAYGQVLWTLHASVHILWELFKIVLLVLLLSLAVAAAWGAAVGLLGGGL